MPIGSYVREPRCASIDRAARSVRFTYLWIVPGGGTGLDQRNMSDLEYFWRCFVRAHVHQCARGLGLSTIDRQDPKEHCPTRRTGWGRGWVRCFSPYNNPPRRRLRRRRVAKLRFFLIFWLCFLFLARGARASLGSCLLIGGTGPPCGGTMSGRGARSRRRYNNDSGHVALTLNPHQ